MTHFDAIIIGSGQGGTPLSKQLARLGWKTALVEKDLVGGTCVNVGCTPTKIMIASAKVAYLVSQAERYGIPTSGYSIDMAKVLDRKKQVVEKFRNGSQEGLQKTKNLQLLFGTAAFTGPKQVKVTLRDGGNMEMTGNKIFIDTGTRPAIPEIEGLEEAGYFTSTTIMEHTHVPDHLLILGGGYVGLELGQMYSRFGSKVTILEHGDQFLPKEDADIAEEVSKFLQAERISIFVSAEATRVQGKAGELRVTIKQKGEEKALNCSHILLAAGRVPNTGSLNVAAAGIRTDNHGFIEVNEWLETSAEDHYAIGDVKGGPQFTHISYNDYLILYHNLAEGKHESMHDRMVPYTMFTDPQLARVGITEQEARQKGYDVRIATLPMTHVARAIETGDTRGMLKAVIDAQKDTLLGVAVVGQEGGEIMSILQMAMMGGITTHQMQQMIFAHPLYAESLNNLFIQGE